MPPYSSFSHEKPMTMQIFRDTRFYSSSNFCGMKLDFPRFNGDDLIGSIYREEQYFNLHNNFYVHNVPLSSFHLEHEELQWFRWYIKDHAEPNWTNFFQLLLQRFGPTAFDDFTRALTKLRQTGTVWEYQTEFEKLDNHTEAFPDAFYLSCIY